MKHTLTAGAAVLAAFALTAPAFAQGKKSGFGSSATATQGSSGRLANTRNSMRSQGDTTTTVSGPARADQAGQDRQHHDHHFRPRPQPLNRTRDMTMKKLITAGAAALLACAVSTAAMAQTTTGTTTGKKNGFAAFAGASSNPRATQTTRARPPARAAR
jgi:hypothetical protein